jgi:lipopolysaccharide export system permease protein
MIGNTLALYFAGRFSRMVLVIFGLFMLLVALISYFDLGLRALSANNFDTATGALVILLRLPTDSLDVLPFAVLFGSMAAFVVANRRLEVVVARAAGLSGWQFLLPAILVGLLVGGVAVTLYTPIAATMVAKANSLDSRSVPGLNPFLGKKTGQVWLRQAGGSHESIIGANGSFDNGLGLKNVTAFVYTRSGQFIERVDAPSAKFVNREWQFSDATVTAPNQVPKKAEGYRLESDFSPEQISQTFELPENISFWALPAIISGAKTGGITGASRYELRYHWLLSLPILLLAMVLIAAVVSLRFSRSQNLARMVLSGIGAGFMLYVISSVSQDLGSGGVVPPALAAWLPAIVATLFGMTVLLHLEDG